MEKELKGMQDSAKKINEDYQKLLDSASDPAIASLRLNSSHSGCLVS